MDTKTCSRCRKQLPLKSFYGNQYWCKQCRKETRYVYMRRYLNKKKGDPEQRKKYIATYRRRRKYWKEYYARPEVKKRNAANQRRYSHDPVRRIKHMARWIFQRAKHAGKIKSQPCAECGSLLSQGHHSDYNKPLLIVWLCDCCHRKKHMELKATWEKTGKREP